jgi:hypothetical protein
VGNELILGDKLGVELGALVGVNSSFAVCERLSKGLGARDGFSLCEAPARVLSDALFSLLDDESASFVSNGLGLALGLALVAVLRLGDMLGDELGPSLGAISPSTVGEIL